MNITFQGAKLERMSKLFSLQILVIGQSSFVRDLKLGSKVKIINTNSQLIILNRRGNSV